MVSLCFLFSLFLSLIHSASNLSITHCILSDKEFNIDSSSTPSLLLTLNVEIFMPTITHLSRSSSGHIDEGVTHSHISGDEHGASATEQLGCERVLLIGGIGRVREVGGGRVRGREGGIKREGEREEG